MLNDVTREVIFDPLDRIRIAVYSQLDGWLDVADGTVRIRFFDELEDFISDELEAGRDD